jgi:hypothetical protein
MGVDEKVTAPVNDERERSVLSLMRINGISRKTAEALYGIGICDYDDVIQYLTQRTEGELSQALLGQGVRVYPKTIERWNWVGQARALADSQEKSESLQPEEETILPSVQDRKKNKAHASRERWHELADFFVSFGFDVGPEGEKRPQTKVHHSQADRPRQWDGFVTDELIGWMLKQANLPLLTETRTQPGAESPGKASSIETKAAPPFTPYDAYIEILGVEVSGMESPVGIWEKNVMAEIRFRVSGSEAKIVKANRIPFRVEFYTIDLDGGSSSFVASEQGQLEPQVTEYVNQQEFLVPEIGHYELHSIVILLPPGEMMAYHRGPNIRVVP